MGIRIKRIFKFARAAFAGLLLTVSSGLAADTLTTSSFWIASAKQLDFFDNSSDTPSVTIKQLSSRFLTVVDPVTERVYTVDNNGKLDVYRSNGMLSNTAWLHTDSIVNLDTRGPRKYRVKPIAFGYSAFNHRLWVISGRALYSYSPSGELLREASLNQKPVSLALRANNGEVWVATRQTIYQFDSTPTMPDFYIVS